MYQKTPKKPILIKKYSNRRLYNTEISNYVTLEDVCQMVKKNEDFIVVDAKTGEDLTHAILTQIIVEQEGKGFQMLPVSFMRQLITFYDDGLRSVIPQYLEETMETFTRNQEHMREYAENALKEFSPLNIMAEIARKNMSLLDTTFKMFSGMGPETNKKDDEQK
jgi:polyhydroxyalkanoate synthesis repressor PhaR